MQATQAQRAVQKKKRREPPAFVEPQLATLVDAAPSGADWVHEIKLDGYRVLARCDGARVRLLTRRGHDWTDRMPSVARALASLALPGALIDGELVALHEGKSSFQRLQNALHDQRAHDAKLVYFAFDLLFWKGRDLRGEPLLERKAELKRRLQGAPAIVRFSEHFTDEGADVFAHACKLGVEGIICKRADAPYSSGRGRAWLKVKCMQRQEFVIGGFSEPQRSRAHFGALLLGVHENGELRYAGRVGTGFNARSLAELHEKLAPLERKSAPFVNPPRGADARDVHWVEPRLVAEVSFVERTSDGSVRHASFQGLREDKPAREVHDERPAPATNGASKRRSTRVARVARPALPKVKLTHPERVLYPEQGITKQDVALYYAQVAKPMLEHLADRPLMLVRCPEGAPGSCFHQKHPSRGMPDSIGRVKVQEKTKRMEHLVVRDIEGLIALVQMGALEIHTWGSHSARIEQPDQLTFDLDPDEGLAWPRVVEAALRVREQLDAIELPSFLKTTGGKGLHVVVPIAPRHEWDVIKSFCKSFAESLVRKEPTKYVTNIAKAKRKNKVLLDYLRNGRGATAVCAYSTRARSGATVSTPIDWAELTDSLDPKTFTIETVPSRIALGDPWKAFFSKPPELTATRIKALRAP